MPCRLVMGTRSGDLDPAVVLHLQTQLGLSVKEADNLLNKKSGWLLWIQAWCHGWVAPNGYQGCP